MSQKYWELDALYNSAVYGGGLYKFAGEWTKNPFDSKQYSNEMAPLLRDVRTEELYFAVAFTANAQTMAYYTRQIRNAPCNTNIFWPKDIVQLTEEQEKILKLQSETSTIFSGRADAIYLLLFSMVDGQNKKNLAQILAENANMNWENATTRAIARDLVQQIEYMNQSGYIYGDIHPSRIFISDTGRVQLSFTKYIYSFPQTMGTAPHTAVDLQTYPIEFAEPALIQGAQKQIDFNTQNYSLSAVLFYLFFHRYPYDGRLLSGYADDSTQNHAIKFRDYHKMPVFIFDEQDDENAIGIFADQLKTVALWNACPDVIKQLFQLSLQQANAERTAPACNPTPMTWLKYLQELEQTAKEMSS